LFFVRDNQLKIKNQIKKLRQKHFAGDIKEFQALCEIVEL